MPKDGRKPNHCHSIMRASIMWSHYAQEHRGAVLEFDTGELPFSQLGSNMIVEVLYTNEKANFLHDPKEGTKTRGTAKFARALFDVARRKAPDWAYEEE